MLVKQQRVAAQSGRYQGLPDIAEARQAADQATEIDLLVLERREIEAKRRYRELTRSTWDETSQVMARWDKIGRAQKLALFG